MQSTAIPTLPSSPPSSNSFFNATSASTKIHSHQPRLHLVIQYPSSWPETSESSHATYGHAAKSSNNGALRWTSTTPNKPQKSTGIQRLHLAPRYLVGSCHAFSASFLETWSKIQLWSQCETSDHRAPMWVGTVGLKDLALGYLAMTGRALNRATVPCALCVRPPQLHHGRVETSLIDHGSGPY